LKTMRDFNIPEHYYHPITRWRLCSPHNSVIFEQPQPWGCIIDVTGVYQYLAEQARAKGATVVTGLKSVHPIMSNGQVTGCEAAGCSGLKTTITSKVLIDASGYTADISKQAGLHGGFTRFGVGAEYELFAPDCRQDEAILIMGNRYAPSGYAWAFPWGKGRVRVGVGILHADSTANPEDYLSKFIGEAAGFDINLAGYQITERHFGLVPADKLISRLVAPGLMAAGDSAGQASQIVGEGIRLSLQAGQLAGQTAARAVLKGTYDRRALIDYERQFNSSYHKNLKAGYLLNKSLAHWDDAKWDKGIDILKSVPNRLLTQMLQSDFSTRDFAWWLARKPRLWPKFIKYGLKVIVH
jgi:digeranylgeranylglycerophospholipid reductase